MGPFSTAPGGLKYAVVAVEYFTDWIEVEALASMHARQVQRFLWKNVICRFGVPRRFTVDNGTQFDCQAFRTICEELGVEVCFPSVNHPKANGKVERANGKIVSALSKRLTGLPKGKWAEELPKVLWALRTTTTRSTGFTPFRLLFGEEAVTQEEVKAGSFRTVTTVEADKAITTDTIEEGRLNAVNNLKKYAEAMKTSYDKKVRPVTLQPGDVILRRSVKAAMVPKLQSKWEGPFVITEMLRPGSCKLATPEGDVLRHTWNVDMLHKFHV